MPRTTIIRQPRVVEYSEQQVAQAVADLEASEQDRQAAYQAARQTRYEQQQAEYQAWRLEQHQKREQEQAEQNARREAYWQEFPHLAPWQWRKERGYDAR